VCGAIVARLPQVRPRSAGRRLRIQQREGAGHEIDGGTQFAHHLLRHFAGGFGQCQRHLRLVRRFGRGLCQRKGDLCVVLLQGRRGLGPRGNRRGRLGGGNGDERFIGFGWDFGLGFEPQRTGRRQKAERRDGGGFFDGGDLDGIDLRRRFCLCRRWRRGGRRDDGRSELGRGGRGRGRGSGTQSGLFEQTRSLRLVIIPLGV